MNIAEKVLQLKQDFDDVYAAGKAAGGGSGDYEQGYEDGKNSVTDYTKYAQSIKFKNLNLFKTKEVVFNFDAATDLTELCYAYHADTDWVQNTTVEHITINAKQKIKNLYRLFANSSAVRADITLKHITVNFELDLDYANGVNFNNAFQNAKGLEIVDGIPLNLSNTKTHNQSFGQCIALREIRFAKNSIKNNISFEYSSELSTETIKSIIDGLADLSGEEQYILVGVQNGPDTFAYPEEEVVIEDIVEVYTDTDYTMDDGVPAYRVKHGSNWLESYAYKKTSVGTAQTLTLHKTVGEKLSDEQKATITAKNWIVAY